MLAGDVFSVVIPVFNKRHTLSRTLRTVLSQTYADFEIVAVDDGSIDDSLAALHRIEDPRLRIVTQANNGPGSARNRGLAEARHGWVAFLDADDLWMPDHLAELDRIRSRFPDAGLIGTRFVTTDRNGRFQLSGAADRKIEPVCLFDCVARGDPALFTSSAAAPLEVLRSMDGFRDFPRGEDSELWARIALQHRVVRSTAETVVYRRGTGGVTDSIPKAWGDGAPGRLKDLSPSVELLLERLPEIGDPRTRAAIEGYIERYLDWTMRNAVAMRDTETLAALTRLYRRSPPRVHRLALAASDFPAPVAVAWASAVIRVDAIIRKLTRRPGSFSSATGPAPKAVPPSRSEE